MSSLHKVINFRQLISKLNDTEFNTLLTKIYSSQNRRDLLTKSLFHLLLYQTKQHNHSTVDNINKTINNIIDLRDKKSNAFKSSSQNNSQQIIPFNTCPSSLTSLISSFLHLSDVINFKLTNRNIYIAVASTLSSLTSIYRRIWIYRYKNNYGYSTYQKDNQMNNLNQFKMVKNIALSEKTMVDIQSSKHYPKCLLYLWQNLNQLTVNNIDLKQNESSELVMNTLKTLKFNHLKLCHINMFECFSFDSLLQLIYNAEKCGMKQLTLQILQTGTRTIQDGEFSKLSANKHLNALCLYQMSSDFNARILPVIGHQLESLHVISDEANETLPTDVNLYSNIKELCFYNLNPESIKYAVTAAGHKLRRLHVSASDTTDWKSLVGIMVHAFQNNFNLEYLGVEIIDSDDVKTFINSFVECMNKSGQFGNKRNWFKLRLNLEFDNVIAQYFVTHLAKILNTFKTNISDFALIISVSFLKESFAEFEKYIEKIKNDNNGYQVIIGEETVIEDNSDTNEMINDTISVEAQYLIRHVTISNEGCRMCCYNENWILECGNCQQFPHDVSTNV